MIDLALLKGKKIGIVGMGRTGNATLKALMPYASELICYDDNENIIPAEFVAYFAPLSDSRWQNLDMMVLSPGLPTTYPAPHHAYSIAKNYNIEITSDIDLLYRANNTKKFIAITGTNGKSTTTALTHHLLNALGSNYDIGGNIGIPVLSLSNEAEGYVLEISSFQAEIAPYLKPNIAVLLNVTPDHLDRHGNMEGYIAAKCKLFQHMGQGDHIIINVDNERTASVARHFNGKARLLPFSTTQIAAGVFSVIDGVVYDNIFTMREYKYEAPKSLQGKHNAENMAAALLAGIINSYSIPNLLSHLSSYKALSHRMEYVGTYKHIEFYNDSKATNADSVSKSLATFKNIYWLAGGVAKDGGIEDLVPLFPNVTKAYFFGQSKMEFADVAKVNEKEFAICQDMQMALDRAIEDAKSSGDKAIILLAPACASFDQFKDYNERGEIFMRLVRGYIDARYSL